MRALERSLLSFSSPWVSLPLLLAAFSTDAEAQLGFDDASLGHPGAYSLLSLISSDTDGGRLVVAQGGGNLTGGPGLLQSSLVVRERDQEGAWVETVALPLPPFETADWFGHSVCFDQGTILVSAPQRSGPIEFSGAVYVYAEASDGTWSLIDEWRTEKTGDVTYFGNAIALDDDTAIVADASTPTAKSLIVFEKQPAGAWQRNGTTLVAPSLDEPEFGKALALDAHRLAVGSPASPYDQQGSGQVHLFERDSQGNWNLTATILAPGGASSEFGSTLALDGDRLVVGAPNESKVWSYSRSIDGTWSFDQQLTPPLPGGTGWSTALELDDARLAVTQISFLYGSGIVDVFEASGDGSWTPKVTLAQSVPPSLLAGFAGDAHFVGEQLVATTNMAGVVPAISVFELGALYHGHSTVSGALGGQQSLLLRAGAEHAGHTFALLGSASGTAPSITDPLFALGVPLIGDAYTDALVLSGGAGVVSPTLGILDANGAADASFVVPAGTSPALVGTVLHHAYVAIDPTTFGVSLASNAVRVELVP